LVFHNVRADYSLRSDNYGLIAGVFTEALDEKRPLERCHVTC
jgi:hypothetical protein